MKVSIVVPDHLVIVDGEARPVAMDGVEDGLHAVQWDGARGEAEYGPPIRRNVPLTDLTPYQVLLDRWMAAAPKPVPPPPPPTKTDLLERALSDVALKAVIVELAARAGLTEAQLRTAVLARMP